MNTHSAIKRSSLSLLAAGLLLCASPAPAQASPDRKEDLTGTYELQGSDSFGDYTGKLHITWEWPSLPVGMKAELHYDDGKVRTWQTGGYYRRSRSLISVGYKLKHSGFIRRLPGAGGAKKIKVRGECVVNHDATRIEATFSGSNFSDRFVATRGAPRAPDARLKGTYVVRSSWSSMTRWELFFHLRQFRGGTVDTGNIAGEPPTQCKRINRDTLQFSVWTRTGESTLVQEVLIARVVNDPAGLPRDLQPLRCYTVTIDPTSNDPADTRVELKPAGATKIHQPDGRILD
jgi:hypothetical protein